MWVYNKNRNDWSITKTSGFITLTFDLYLPDEEKTEFIDCLLED